MQKISLFLATAMVGLASISMAQTEAGKQKFEQKFNAKIIKTFDTDNPTEALLGMTSIAVAYSGSLGDGPKYYVATCEKNDQDGYGSLWVYRSADEGATWTLVAPSTNDIPAQYQTASWLAGKPTFSSEKGWTRMAAYENNKPKAFPPYLSGYWSSPGSSVCTWTGSTWVVASGSNATLTHVPVCVYRTSVSGTGPGEMQVHPGETNLDNGMLESGTVASGTSGTSTYASRYAYEYKFKVARSGWGSGGASGTDTHSDIHTIVSETISTGTFEATYYYSGTKKRTFIRDSSPTSEGPTVKPSGAGDPHSVLIQPGALASYTPPAVPTSTDTSFELAYNLPDPHLVSAYSLIDSTPNRYHTDANALRDGTYNGSLFFYNGSEGSLTNGNIGLYLFSLGRSYNGTRLSVKFCVRKSTDAGLHWSDVKLLSNVPGDFDGTAPAIFKGRIWIAFGSTQVISASLNDDITLSSSWIVSQSGNGNYDLPRVITQANWLAGRAQKDLNFRILSQTSLITDPNNLFPTTGFSESCLVAGPETSAAPGVWLLPKIAEQPYTAKIGITTGWFTSGTINKVLTTEFSGTTGGPVDVLPNAFDPARDIVYLPGAGVKFIAQYVPGLSGQPGKFYALTNPELEPYQCSRLVDRDGNAYTQTALERYNASNYENPGATRNTGAIYTSTNLKEWHLEKIFVHSAASELVYAPSYGKIREGFSTFAFAIDGDDMLIVSRTAADIGQYDDASIDLNSPTPSFTFAAKRFPTRGLDANLFTFHRVKNFRNLNRDMFLAADKGGDKVFLYEATNGDPAKVGQFNLPAQPTVTTPSGIVQTTGTSGDVFIASSAGGGSIERYHRDGTYVSTLCNFSGGDTPMALATGTSTLLYATVTSGTTTKLYKVSTPATGGSAPTYIATLATGGAFVNLASRDNGLAVASTGLIYSATPGGFARISTTGATVAVSSANSVLALCRSGTDLYVAQTTSGSSPALSFSTLSNVTLTALSLGAFPAPTTGLVQSGTSLFWTGSSAPAGWEMTSTPLP